MKIQLQDLESLKETILEELLRQQEVDLDSEKEDQDEAGDDEIVTAEFEVFTQYGQADVRFSVPMNTEQLNLTEFDSLVAEVYIIPYDDWHLYKEGFVVYPNLNLTWIVNTFKGDLLQLNVTFNDPDQISPLTYGQDIIVFHIR